MCEIVRNIVRNMKVEKKDQIKDHKSTRKIMKLFATFNFLFLLA